MAKVVDLFDAGRPVEQAPKIHHDMERAVEQLQGQFPDMEAFVVFAIDHDGRWSTRYSMIDGSIIGRRMLAGVACEGIRENLVTDTAIALHLGDEV